MERESFLEEVRMANRTKLTAEKKAQFLELLSKCPNVTAAARQIGLTRAWMYEVRKHEGEEEFAKAWDEAVKEGVQTLEQEMWSRAVDGVQEPVFYQGEVCGYVRKPSDTLAIFLAKAHDPEKYRETRALVGPGGGPLQMVHKTEELSDEQLAEIAAQGVEDDE